MHLRGWNLALTEASPPCVKSPLHILKSNGEKKIALDFVFLHSLNFCWAVVVKNLGNFMMRTSRSEPLVLSQALPPSSTVIWSYSAPFLTSVK